MLDAPGVSTSQPFSKLVPHVIKRRRSETSSLNRFSASHGQDFTQLHFTIEVDLGFWLRIPAGKIGKP